MTMFPRSTFPLKRGYHVQFFLRTRKDGEPVVAGISSRCLARVATAWDDGVRSCISSISVGRSRLTECKT